MNHDLAARFVGPTLYPTTFQPPLRQEASYSALAMPPTDLNSIMSQNGCSSISMFQQQSSSTLKAPQLYTYIKPGQIQRQPFSIAAPIPMLPDSQPLTSQPQMNV